MVRLIGAAMLALVAGCAAPAPQGSGRAPAIPTPAGPASDVNVPTPSLLELRVPELRARFGEPGSTRRDGGAEIWTYEALGTCRLNLVLQRERGTQKVVHAQARMPAGGAEAVCLERLGRRR